MAITAFFHVKADRLDGAPAIIADTLVGTRGFPGNLSVEVIVDTADPTHFVLLEKWDTAESDHAYHAWRATAEGRSSLREILDGAPVVTQFSTLEF
jgi:quinol monooxygenase YgiN